MSSSRTRRPLHSQPEPEQQAPFFSSARQEAQKDGAFFQTKLAVGDKDDRQEKEADAAAGQVLQPANEKEKKPDTPDPANDKQQRSEKSAAGQASGNEKGKAPDKKTDREQNASTVKQGNAENKMAAINDAGQTEKKEPEKGTDNSRLEEDKTKISKKEDTGVAEQDELVRKKEAGPAPGAAHKVSLEERIKKSKGKGHTLPDDARALLEAELGADFSEVVIHTDGEAVAMNKELNALAFTNGFDIYFNEGQYDPRSKAGQKLLAHELAHVIQQTGISKK